MVVDDWVLKEEFTAMMRTSLNAEKVMNEEVVKIDAGLIMAE